MQAGWPQKKAVDPITPEQRRLWRERTAFYRSAGLSGRDAEQEAMAELVLSGGLCRWTKRRSDTEQADSWPLDLAELIQWFDAHGNALPCDPSDLTPWIHVSDPARFYAALRTDIAAGPRGPRARLGGLRADLKALRRTSPTLDALKAGVNLGRWYLTNDQVSVYCSRWPDNRPN